MAEAGFYSVVTGADDADAAKCFLSRKELDSWEADDPWAEHKRHDAKCAFVQIEKKDDLTLAEFLSTIKKHMYNDIKRLAECCQEKINEKRLIMQIRCMRRK